MICKTLLKIGLFICVLRFDKWMNVNANFVMNGNVNIDSPTNTNVNVIAKNANNYFIVANNVKLGKCQIMAKKLSQDCR